jgi:hypothetical protein
MLRQAFTDRLKQAMKARDARTVSTVRMILAGLKERDVAARGEANANEIAEPEIARMLQAMIKQRREAIELYDKGGRPELAEKERGEIAVIERFLPKQLSDAETEAAVKDVIAAIGAAGIKDMGRTMASLRERYAGQLDPAKASQIAKKLLG